MLLRGEVDDPALAGQVAFLDYEHFANLHVSALLHAASYARAFSGNASRNISAIPLPMTPTSLTVLINASVDASSRFPWVNSIIRSTNRV